ncbi:MAG: N-acetylmuramoyl-L-alanine amidase [Thermodesulfobacteriota bacterium]
MTKRSLISVLLICGLAVFWSCATTGAEPNNRYFKAEASYNDLQEQPDKQQYRTYWMDCIHQFKSVYESDPDGPWAAAGLYMTGHLYRQLHQHSYKPSDLSRAKRIFRKIVKKYPSSAYCAKARKGLKKIAERDDQPDLAAQAKKQYFKAESAFSDLQKAPEKQKYRVYWLDCIRKFETVHAIDPDGPWAAAGLFMTARLYQELYRHSYKPADRREARQRLQQVIADYPDSKYQEKARARLQGSPKNADSDTVRALTGGQTTSGEVTAARGKGEKEAKGEKKEKDSGQSTGDHVTEVTGIRYWSNPEYTRVVIDANRETDFKNNLLDKDPSINKPHKRLYVDLKKSRLGEDIKRQIAIDDTLLKDVRAGQHATDTVRVVVDIKSFENYNVFSLKNPFRVVIDVRGESASPSETAGTTDTDREDSGKSSSIARQLALGVGRIVIDPGHGGKDPGAPGAVDGVYEKQIVMDLAETLGKEIRRELGCEVLFTRRKDKYLTLEERTAIANTKQADLFISLHANASKNGQAHGLETYFLNLTTDDESIAVAARENATSKKNIGELQNILNDLMQNAKINESSRLATYVQGALYQNLSDRYNRINNKGVKQAPFYVLLGAQMPSILIETAFISNKRECRRLLDPQYQKTLCRGILDGIKRYIETTRPTAFLSEEQSKGANR